VSRVHRLDLIADFLLFHQQQSLSFHFHIVLFLFQLLSRAGLQVVRRVFFLFALLFLLVLFGRPDLVHVEQFYSDDIPFQGPVAVFGPTDINVCLQNIRRDVCV
jgi:hypothetical protein